MDRMPGMFANKREAAEFAFLMVAVIAFCAISLYSVVWIALRLV